jgi:hypothetical protein
MLLAAKLSRKLYETIGDEAAEATLTWMDSVERTRAEAFCQEIRGELLVLRDEMRGGLAAVRDEMNGGFAALREEMHAGFTRLEVAIERVNGRIDTRYLDLLKWSLTFWVGTALAIAGTLVALARLGR